MSTANHAIRKFNRFELKYLLTLRQAGQFKSALRAYMTPDEHSNNDGRYALASLYFDSPDLRCYWEKEYGLRFRRKLRIRRYETGEPLTEDTPVFVEIKQRVDRVTQKRRAVLTYGDALRLCLDRQLPECDPEDLPVIEEIHAFLWQYNLRPRSIVRYDRQAFIGSDYDIGLRVTFDSSLSFQAQHLYLHEESSALAMLPANQVVMEIKINEHMPIWLTELIAAQNLQMVRVSKYGRSIEAAQNMPALRWNSLPAESSGEALASTLSVFSRLEQKLGIRGTSL